MKHSSPEGAVQLKLYHIQRGVEIPWLNHTAGSNREETTTQTHDSKTEIKEGTTSSGQYGTAKGTKSRLGKKQTTTGSPHAPIRRSWNTFCWLEGYLSPLPSSLIVTPQTKALAIMSDLAESKTQVSLMITNEALQS